MEKHLDDYIRQCSRMKVKAPEEAWLVAYLIDAVTGCILHRVTHHGAQGPVHRVVSAYKDVWGFGGWG